MIIIADTGATKTEWASIDYDGDIIRCETEGMNFSVMGAKELSPIVHKAMDEINPDGAYIESMHIYAAGLLENDEKVRKLFYVDGFEAASDMLGAARAACCNEPGIVAILGTGSNSCLYDGRRIVSNVHPGGYILGDEGGGATLGRLFLSDLIKGLVPSALAEKFAQTHEADYVSIVRNVYKNAAPSGYLGSLAPWIVQEAPESEYLTRLVDSNLRAFFERSLLRYGRKDLPVGFVGGMGFALQDRIRILAEEYGLEIKEFVRQPIDGLIRYHYDR